MNHELRWQKQTRFGGVDAEPGNKGDCTSACIASLLVVPLHTVPVFVEFDDFWKEQQNWLSTYGLSGLVIGYREGLEEVYGNILCIAGGDGPRGHGHSVVWRIGTGMVFDPHPSNAGLVGDPLELMFLVPIDIAEWSKRT